MAGRSPVTLLDVAKRAGVSLATASRVVNGSDRRVSARLRDVVLRAAQELRYVRNANAQALARSRTSIVGVIVHDIADPYFTEVLRGIEPGAASSGRLLLVCDSHNDPQREREYLTVLHAHRASTIILAGSGREDPEHEEQVAAQLDAFIGSGGRVVTIGRHGYETDSVRPDNRAGAQMLGAELIRLGHRRVGIIAGIEQITSTIDRVAGLLDAYAQANLGFDAIIRYGPFHRDHALASVAAFLDDARPPTAIVAHNDDLAVAALRALHVRGVRVPDDMTVVGFDDLPIAADVVPALTTVRLPLRELGASAIRLALDAGSETRRDEVLPAELIVRESSGTAHEPSRVPA